MIIGRRLAWLTALSLCSLVPFILGQGCNPIPSEEPREQSVESPQKEYPTQNDTSTDTSTDTTVIATTSVDDEPEDPCLNAPRTAYYAHGVHATVTDAITGMPIDNATLSLKRIIPGSVIESPMEFLLMGVYLGAGEAPGTYTLMVIAPGYQTQVFENIVVEAINWTCEMHVKTVYLDVKLQTTF